MEKGYWRVCRSEARSGLCPPRLELEIDRYGNGHQSSGTQSTEMVLLRNVLITRTGFCQCTPKQAFALDASSFVRPCRCFSRVSSQVSNTCQSVSNTQVPSSRQSTSTNPAWLHLFDATLAIATRTGRWSQGREFALVCNQPAHAAVALAGLPLLKHQSI